MKNRDLSQADFFIKLCEKHGIKPTKRQASRYQMKKGSLYKKEKGLLP
jgi:hypothetical protein